MVRRVDGWVTIIVRACLEGMGEITDSQEEMNRWLEADVRFLSCIYILKNNSPVALIWWCSLQTTPLNKTTRKSLSRLWIGCRWP